MLGAFFIGPEADLSLTHAAQKREAGYSGMQQPGQQMTPGRKLAALTCLLSMNSQ